MHKRTPAPERFARFGCCLENEVQIRLRFDCVRENATPGVLAVVRARVVPLNRRLVACYDKSHISWCTLKIVGFCPEVWRDNDKLSSAQQPCLELELLHAASAFFELHMIFHALFE